MAIGKMKEVPLRELWRHEQYDFSEWLSQEENITELSEVIGLTLTDIETEKSVGSFRCDILCKDEMTNKVVLIENQLEATNHDHLGKIITYGAALNASVIVWVVKTARPEHRSAIEWLNSHTDGEISFFLIEVHAYRIGNSDATPMFKIIEEPNNFVLGVKAVEKAQNETMAQRLQFWTMFNEVVAAHNNPFNQRKATTDHWYDVAIGTSLCHITIELVNKENCIRVSIYITNSKGLYDVFYLQKFNIESEIGYELEWRRNDSAKASMISTYIRGLNFADHSNYKELMEQTIQKVIEFRKVFKKYL